MKRRKFGLMSAAGLAAMPAGLGTPRKASAAVSAAQADLLKTTLTPIGAERAGNADGSIPAWTGGMTTVPPGWSADKLIMTDPFADEKPVFTVNAANMSQYAPLLSDGVTSSIRTHGFRLDVYPTHRTAAAPQAVYDRIYQNALNGQPNGNGARFGFQNAYGGVPFPIPDAGDNQGAEIIWNHLARWSGYNFNRTLSSFYSGGGSVSLAATLKIRQSFPYYDPQGSLATFDNTFTRLRNTILAPPPLYDQDLIEYDHTDPLQQPSEVWQLLQGQGRVRKAPELTFDTPAPGSSGILNYDELQGFFGSPVRYNWKSLGKAEMLIPYNNNGQFFKEPNELLLPNFLNPDFVRWEKHRVWVIDAVLAPGERNVFARRRFYVDEDTWTVALVDEYDGVGNLARVLTVFNEVRPDIPCVLYAGTLTYDVPSNSYVFGLAPWNDPTYGSPLDTQNSPPETFNPQDMAAQAQY